MHFLQCMRILPWTPSHFFEKLKDLFFLFTLLCCIRYNTVISTYLTSSQFRTSSYHHHHEIRDPHSHMHICNIVNIYFISHYANPSRVRKSLDHSPSHLPSNPRTDTTVLVPMFLPRKLSWYCGQCTLTIRGLISVHSIFRYCYLLIFTASRKR
jgi:hypothetical protein